MPDIAMCKDHECPSRHVCWRYLAPPTPDWQPYAAFERLRKTDRCDFYWRITNGKLPGVLRDALLAAESQEDFGGLDEEVQQRVKAVLENQKIREKFCDQWNFVKRWTFTHTERKKGEQVC